MWSRLYISSNSNSTDSKVRALDHMATVITNTENMLPWEMDTSYCITHTHTLTHTHTHTHTHNLMHIGSCHWVDTCGTIARYAGGNVVHCLGLAYMSEPQTYISLRFLFFADSWFPHISLLIISCIWVEMTVSHDDNKICGGGVHIHPSTICFVLP